MITLFHQDHFDDVLNLLNGGNGVATKFFFQHKDDNIGDMLGLQPIVQPLRAHGLINRLGYFLLSKIDDRTIPFFNPGNFAGFNHFWLLLIFL